MNRVLMASIAASTVAAGAVHAQDSRIPNLEQLKTMTARFAPVDLSADVMSLPANERQALARLVEAAKVMDTLFLRQVWAGNETMLLELLQDSSELGRARLHYFLINKGPWSRLDENAPFIPGAPKKPEQANFYPAGATKEEVEAWIATLSGSQRAFAIGFFTTIRRNPEGKFVAVPYSFEYQGELARVAELLREAAALTTQPTLKVFLEKRAQALITNDYYDSDVAWMELDASIEPTIGPYEVYEDEWFNYKAAFESFITVRDAAETNKLTRFGSELQEIENNLPIDPKYRNPKLGAMAPIRVVRGADRRLQPAERRADRRREGHEAHHAQEHPGGEVPEGPAADLPGGPRGRGSGERGLRRVLHPHPDARADARPRSAQYRGG